MKVYFFLMWFAMVTILAYFTGYQAAREKYERKGQWYAEETEHKEMVELQHFTLQEPINIDVKKGDFITVGVSNAAIDDDGKIVSAWFSIYVNNLKAYEGKVAAVPSENKPATWPEAADRDMRIELKY